jgi:chemotaxis response regulator CheB
MSKDRNTSEILQTLRQDSNNTPLDWADTRHKKERRQQAQQEFLYGMICILASIGGWFAIQHLLASLGSIFFVLTGSTIIVSGIGVFVVLHGAYLLFTSAEK